jgi:co-chaperonin GroES (HSP10)
MSKLQAVFNSIIVKPLDEEEITYGSIVVPDLGKEKGLRGTIVSVGPGYYCATGQFVTSTLKEGQQVVLPAVGVSKVELDGQEYWSCSENQVLAVIND